MRVVFRGIENRSRTRFTIPGANLSKSEESISTGPGNPPKPMSRCVPWVVDLHVFPGADGATGGSANGPVSGDQVIKQRSELGSPIVEDLLCIRSLQSSLLFVRLSTGAAIPTLVDRS